jgi:4-amino-4-deoxy-L-arabinose transferase-like glycosyltransferase
LVMHTIDPSFRQRAVKLFIFAAMFRLLFLIWSWTSWHAEAQTGASQLYFRQGYGLAAGYGLIAWYGESGEKLKDLSKAVEDGKMIALPGDVPPMEAKDVHYSTFHPPGMALLVAGLYRLTKVPASLPVEVTGLIWDSLATVLLYWLVSRAWSPNVGYATGIIYAFFPPAAYGSASSRSPEGMIAIFIAGMMVCLWMALVEDPRRWHGWCVLGGLALGLGCYFRPDYLMLPTVLVVAAWAVTRKFWVSLRNLMVIQLMCYLVLSPWAYRNYVLTGHWLFTGSVVGATLITGLGEFQNPWGYKVSDTDRQQEALAQGFEAWNSPEADIYFRNLFWQSIKENPKGYFMSIIKRVPLALAPPMDFGLDNPFKQHTFAESRQNQDADRYQIVKSAPFHTFLAYADELVMAAMALGALIAWGYMAWKEPQRWAIGLFLISPHVYALSTHLMTHFEPRFLLPSVGFLLIGLAYLVVAFNARRKTGLSTAPVRA